MPSHCLQWCAKYCHWKRGMEQEVWHIGHFLFCFAPVFLFKSREQKGEGVSPRMDGDGQAVSTLQSVILANQPQNTQPNSCLEFTWRMVHWPFPASAKFCIEKHKYPIMTKTPILNPVYDLLNVHGKTQNFIYVILLHNRRVTRSCDSGFHQIISY